MSDSDLFDAVAHVTGEDPRDSRLRPHAGPAPRRRYERRRPEKTPLHKIISENLASWLEWRDEAERPVPGYVEEELRGYLECGILCFSLRPCPLHGLRPGVCHRVLVPGARGFLADRPAAVAALTRIFIEEIERLLGVAAGVTSDASAPAAARPRLGAISPATASARR